MYRVETRRLNEQVKRHISRFPNDFMFQLTEEEFQNLISQNATSSWGGSRKLPYAFTEQGVSMLSGVLNSPVTIQVHIQIIRVFTKMREMLVDNKEIMVQPERMERDMQKNKEDEDIKLVFGALKKLLAPPPALPRKRIGFKPDF